VPLDALPPLTIERLRQVAAAAGGRAWLVGGAVRDLLLGRTPLDIDVTVAGNAEHVARRLPAKVVARSQFLTVVIRWPDGEEWDLVTARRERYLFPGDLPEVTPGKITDDLLRRDFTINAMAAALAPGAWGELLDPALGAQDLRLRQLRILHPDSFRDDPTRLLRLARYMARLGFAPDRATRWAAVLEPPVDGFAGVSGDRVRAELERSLGPREDGAAQISAIMEVRALSGLWLPLLPSPDVVAATEDLLRELAPVELEVWLVRLAALPDIRDRAEALAGLGDQLSLGRRQRAVLQDLRALLAARTAARTPARLAALFDDHEPEALVALAAQRPSMRSAVVRYLTEWRHVRPALDGHAVGELGCPPGPAVGRVLAALRAARLDGKVVDPAQEEALARRLIAKEVHASR
jgi:tRNA nucleotidyltransferase (CCA-adding enzyme)